MQDESIVRLFWERSQDALPNLDQKYGRLLRRVAGNVLRDPRDAEEALSDAYMRLWSSIPPERPENLPAYAVRVARNAALDTIRKKRRKKRSDYAELLYSELEDCLPDNRGVDEALDERELAERINRYLRTLDADTRQMFVRRYFAMDELAALAADFQLTKHAVSARLYRARQGLQEALRKEGMTV